MMQVQKSGQAELGKRDAGVFIFEELGAYRAVRSAEAGWTHSEKEGRVQLRPVEDGRFCHGEFVLADAVFVPGCHDLGEALVFKGFRGIVMVLQHVDQGRRKIP